MSCSEDAAEERDEAPDVASGGSGPHLEVSDHQNPRRQKPAPRRPPKPTSFEALRTTARADQTERH
ncbi:MAG: hypothetical protein AUK47_06595 [Deltaproteobacteria bacterium CG2_30_63_29]|nr:MAG: hypothetical protein AUK47_06595 [Deltaproteobacteria bacterium CG2_30_63_29]PIW00939.1 MAG: hypothetical protein COW42_06405 [Deltaproteobacteria bacterium CG17_big_fil_post_rev_8_21_14_2_50_63_7]PJB40521.1 MAG: hypothetical protein CO108_14635 [Deltaproteobacteria bacterium CG_4_9_14_3_um_filter_63_12]